MEMLHHSSCLLQLHPLAIHSNSLLSLSWRYLLCEIVQLILVKQLEFFAMKIDESRPRHLLFHHSSLTRISESEGREVLKAAEVIGTLPATNYRSVRLSRAQSGLQGDL